MLNYSSPDTPISGFDTSKKHVRNLFFLIIYYTPPIGADSCNLVRILIIYFWIWHTPWAKNQWISWRENRNRKPFSHDFPVMFPLNQSIERIFGDSGPRGFSPDPSALRGLCPEKGARPDLLVISATDEMDPFGTDIAMEAMAHLIDGFPTKVSIWKGFSILYIYIYIHSIC